jgi:hypothetical protein
MTGAKKKMALSPPAESGYACPDCGCRHLEARGRDGQVGRIWITTEGVKRRRKYCRNCGRGVFTNEVVKKNQ